MHRGD